MSAPLLRLRSDDQLVALFRSGHDDAFRVIHDRYRQRLFAYTRQMLPGSSQDAEDALQDVFVRAYAGLRANDRQLALRPWLYRVAHNRCVDELRRPVPPPPAILHQASPPTHDPIVQVEQRESLRRLILDLRRLPAQQRSALLMRELGGMSYAEIAGAMDVSVPAVKSLLVRARVGLTLAGEARDTACVQICDEITLAHDRGVRSSGTVRRHLADCRGCRQFQSELRTSRRQLAALAPTIGPLGVLANMLGIGGGGAAGGGAGAAATGGVTATGAVLGGGSAATAGSLAAGASHVATLIAAAVVTAGGAVAIQHSITTAPPHHAVHTRVLPNTASAAPTVVPLSDRGVQATQAPESSASASSPLTAPTTGATTSTAGGDAAAKAKVSTSISGGDNLVPTASAPGGTTDSTPTGAAGETPTGTVTPTGTNGTDGTGTTSSTGSTGANGTSSTGTGAGTATNSGTGTEYGTGTPTGAGTGTGPTGTGQSPATSTGATGTSAPGTGTTASTGTGSGPGSSTGT